MLEVYNNYLLSLGNDGKYRNLESFFKALFPFNTITHHCLPGKFIVHLCSRYKISLEEYYDLLNKFCLINNIELTYSEHIDDYNFCISKAASFSTFSFFKAPIFNKIPDKTITLDDLYTLVRYERAYEEKTQLLREIKDKEEARTFKAKQFDYVTISGIFSHRQLNGLIKHSGLICLDFDDIDNLVRLENQLIKDEHTLILFRSPSGNGFKWIIQVDPSIPHAENFKDIQWYLKKKYDVAIDPSGKDVTRACFIPHHSEAFINPKLI